MTLTNLKTYLDGAKTGTDIEAVLFNFLVYANTKRSIAHPFVIWDIGNLDGNKDLRATTGVTGEIEIDLYGLDLVTPEHDITDGVLAIWDRIEADLKAYLINVNALEYIKVLNMSDVDYEYYPGGMLKMEREVGVRYRINLEIWC
jgi:hypothetical protein